MPLNPYLHSGLHKQEQLFQVQSMGRFQITLIRPQGYLHTEAFREIAETLQYGLEGLGHTARIQENAVDSSAVNIILGAHLLSAEQMCSLPPGSIIYNL